jgi:hypothetical protein
MEILELEKLLINLSNSELLALFVGLTDDQLTHYSRVGHNVEFDIEIDFEGKAVATHVNGIALVEPVEI